MKIAYMYTIYANNTLYGVNLFDISNRGLNSDPIANSLKLHIDRAIIAYEAKLQGKPAPQIKAQVE